MARSGVTEEEFGRHVQQTCGGDQLASAGAGFQTVDSFLREKNINFTQNELKSLFQFLRYSSKGQCKVGDISEVLFRHKFEDWMSRDFATRAVVPVAEAVEEGQSTAELYSNRAACDWDVLCGSPKYRKIFKCLDANKDGKISRASFEHFLQNSIKNHQKTKQN